MAKTRHIHQRMNQRGVTQQMLEIVKQFGVDNGDKIILNRKGLDVAISALNTLSKNMQKMRSKGGVVLVEDNNTEITTYALDSYTRNKSFH